MLGDNVIDFNKLVRFWNQAGLERLRNLNFRITMGEFSALGQKSLCRVTSQVNLGSVLKWPSHWHRVNKSTLSPQECHLHQYCCFDPAGISPLLFYSPQKDCFDAFSFSLQDNSEVWPALVFPGKYMVAVSASCGLYSDTGPYNDGEC